MDAMTTLRERVLGGETTFGSWLSTGSPVVAEIAGQAGFDWLVIDTEHGMGSEAGILPQLHAIGNTGATGLVRIERSERLRVSRALDYGAGGLVVPRVDSAADVEQALAWMRFPPEGQRGIALGVRGQGFGRVGHGDIGDAERRGRSGSSRSRTPPRSPMPRPSPRSLARTSCSSGRRTCPTPSASRAGSTSRSTWPPSTRSSPRAGRHGKGAGILLYDPAAIAPTSSAASRSSGLGRTAASS